MNLSETLIMSLLIICANPVRADTIQLKSGQKLENVRTRTEGSTIIVIGKEQVITRLEVNQVSKRSLGPKKRPNYTLRAIVWPGWGEYKKNSDDPLGKRLMGGFGALALTTIYAAQEHLAAKRMYNNNTYQSLVSSGAFTLIPGSNLGSLALAKQMSKKHYQALEQRKNEYALLGNTTSILMAIVYGWNLFRRGVFSRKKSGVQANLFQRVHIGLGQNQSKQNYIVVGVKF